MSNLLKIEAFLSTNCPSEPMLKDHIEKALALEGLSAEVTFKRLSGDEAERLGLKGSPTVKINGEEIQPLSEGEFS